MTQNELNTSLLLQNFFNKNPDVREARNKGLVNRRALAKYILKKENLNVNRFEALVTALRRFEINKESKAVISSFREIKISTKDNLSIIYLEKTEDVLKNVSKIFHIVDFNKNDTLKIVLGSLSVKIFVDDFNLNKINEIFGKNIIVIYKNISELNLIFPDKSTKEKGQLAYLTSELAINNINIIELLTGKPELVIYVEEKDLLKAYETIKRLKEIN